jgi:hypothetical protein
LGNRTSKYHNQRVTRNGRIFDSKHEAGRYTELKLLERSGKITGLKTQVSYLLIPAQYENGKCIERSCKYVADFVYWQDGNLVVEDAKGLKTDVYRIKRKLMLKEYGIKIKEV